MVDDVGGFKDTRAPLMLSESFFSVDTNSRLCLHVKPNRTEKQAEPAAANADFVSQALPDFDGCLLKDV